jgi:N-acetylmuramoyl-L-alanine amidase
VVRKMEINKTFLSKYNFGKRGWLDKIKYIVIHETDNWDVGANAKMHYNFFEGGDRQSSADFFVDNNEVRQIIDYTKNYGWSVGDGNGKYGITNRNSVSIELCVNSDGDYNKTFENAIELAYKLHKELGIPLINVVRHYDASRKNCPSSMSPNDWERWRLFKWKLEVKAEDEEFANIIKQFTSSSDYWIQNARRGSTCNGEWTRALIKKMFKQMSGK